MSSILQNEVIFNHNYSLPFRAWFRQIPSCNFPGSGALVIEVHWSSSSYLPAHDHGRKYLEMAHGLAELMKGRLSRGAVEPDLAVCSHRERRDLSWPPWGFPSMLMVGRLRVQNFKGLVIRDLGCASPAVLGWGHSIQRDFNKPSVQAE